MRVRIILGLCLLIVVAALATGCGESATSPGTGLEVNNAVDTFQYQVTNVRKYTHETTYAWQTTGAVASVNQATTVTRGSVTLVLLDATGPRCTAARWRRTALTRVPPACPGRGPFA